MADDTEPGRDETIPANDNRGPDGEAQAKIDAAVMTIARLIGRQIAREEFARRMAVADNDNRPTPKADQE
jgi:hypothetical protein